MSDALDTITLVLPEGNSPAVLKCIHMIEDAAMVKCAIIHDYGNPQSGNVLQVLQSIASTLNARGKKMIAEALEEVVYRCLTLEDFGGYGMDIDAMLNPQQEADITFLCSAYLEAVKSAARAQSKPAPLKSRPAGRPGMTMAEKIFAMHDVSRKGYVRPGDIIQVDVDWVLASELSWAVSLVCDYTATLIMTFWVREWRESTTLLEGLESSGTIDSGWQVITVWSHRCMTIRKSKHSWKSASEHKETSR